MAWTDDRVEILKKLWAEGLSASQIARELGDVTRNAVIGKVHRLGLAGRASPTKPKSRLRHREHIDYGESSYPGSSRSRINDNVKPLVMPEPAVTSDGEPINILSLNLNTLISFHYCGLFPFLFILHYLFLVILSHF